MRRRSTRCKNDYDDAHTLLRIHCLVPHENGVLYDYVTEQRPFLTASIYCTRGWILISSSNVNGCFAYACSAGSGSSSSTKLTRLLILYKDWRTFQKRKILIHDCTIKFCSLHFAIAMSNWVILGKINPTV